MIKVSLSSRYCINVLTIGFKLCNRTKKCSTMFQNVVAVHVRFLHNRKFFVLLFFFLFFFSTEHWILIIKMFPSSKNWINVSTKGFEASNRTKYCLNMFHNVCRSTCMFLAKLIIVCFIIFSMYKSFSVYKIICRPQLQHFSCTYLLVR